MPQMNNSFCLFVFGFEDQSQGNYEIIGVVAMEFAWPL